ncbi:MULTISPECIES: MIP/aquaporin family protein [unclassified Streptomyces]|uniref:MIP/aquaporin family protein n=1 Tax=unclassified Streptomyces TaxID=2593676 RepID=UPI002E154D72|nr:MULTISPECIES: aquaporin [unclassified Streptomyces]WSR23186.1 aquaporin [Streptomyces sp. NBC_01205]
MSGGEMSRPAAPAGEPGRDTDAGPAPVSTAPEHRARPLHEFALTAVLMFAVVTIIRWVLDPASPLALANVHLALLVVGALAGALLFALIRSPWGRRSGGHMNPAVTLALWRLRAFPGRAVATYVVAQLGGSVAGTVLARLAWGPAVARVGYGAAAAAPSWNGWAVFAAEAACLVVVTLVIGYFLVHPDRERWFPPVLAVLVGAIVAVLGPLSGGAANPARQFGPVLMSGTTAGSWVYLVAPALGAVLGAAAHHRIVRGGPFTRGPRRDGEPSPTAPPPPPS